MKSKQRILFGCYAMVLAIIGDYLLNLISEGLDSGFESFGWLVLYLVCALCLTKKKEAN